MIGVLVGAVFGGVWGLAGASGLRGAARGGLAVLVLVTTLALVAAALALRPVGWPLERAFDLPVYMVAVIAEAILIPLCAVTLQRRGRAKLIPVAAAAVVALHFIGLWLATGASGFLVLSLALLAPPAAAALRYRRDAALAGHRPLAITGLGSFVVLSLAALSGLILH